MKKGKYVVFKNGQVRTFPISTHHSSIVAKVKQKPVSAGRFKVTGGGKVTTYDKSHGLDIYPKSTDKAKVAKKILA